MFTETANLSFSQILRRLFSFSCFEQIDNPSFVAADTMDCWIREHRDGLNRLLKKIDCLVVNEDEAKMLVDEHNLIKAAEAILDMGPSIAVVKKGESGSMICSADERFVLPAFPARQSAKGPRRCRGRFPQGALFGCVWRRWGGTD